MVGSTEAPTPFPTPFPTPYPTPNPRQEWHFTTDGDQDGWNCNGVYNCGHYGSICGGLDRAGQNHAIAKTISVLDAGSYRMSLDFFKIDSWDGETGYVYVNGVQCWSRTFTYSEGTNTCGGHHGGGEVMVHISCDTGHISEGGSVNVRVTTSLDQHADDESFGIDNVVLERI